MQTKESTSYYKSSRAEFYKVNNQYHLYLGEGVSRVGKYHKVCYSLDKMLEHITKLLSEDNIYKDDLVDIGAMISSQLTNSRINVERPISGPTPDYPKPIYQQSDRYNNANEAMTAEEASLILNNIDNDRPRCFGDYNFYSHESRCLLCGIEAECMKCTKNRNNEKFKNTVKKENECMKMMDNLLNELYPSKIPTGEVAITMKGEVVVSRSDGSYVRYDNATKKIQNQMDLVMRSKSLDKMYMLVPTKADQLKPEDIIRDQDTYYQIIKVDITTIQAIDLHTGLESTITIENNLLLGMKMYKKVVSLFDMTKANNDSVNVMNPMMLMMLMDDNSSSDDTMKMFAMMSMMNQGNMQSINNPMVNPMMLMMLSDKSGDNDLIKAMLMMNMMTNATSASPGPKSLSPMDNSTGELIPSLLDDGR